MVGGLLFVFGKGWSTSAQFDEWGQEAPSDLAPAAVSFFGVVLERTKAFCQPRATRAAQIQTCVPQQPDFTYMLKP